MKFLRRLENKIKSIPLWLKIVFIVILILRIPSLFYPYSYGDECIYLTLGEAVRRGVTLYKQIHDNKPPLLYLLAGLSGSLFWFRAILAFWNLATIYLFFLVAKTFFPKKQTLVKVTTILFGLLSTGPLLEGNIANAEIFMLLPTLAGILLLFCGKKLTFKRVFIAGVLFSLAALFKIPAAFDFAAIFIFLALFSPKDFKKEWRPTTKILTFFALGFLFPILATIIYYFAKGAASQYLIAAFLQNIGYLSSWKAGSQTGSPAQSGLFLRGLAALGFTFLLWFFRKRFEKTSLLVFLWFAFSLFAALLSERPYPHYLIQTLPPLCLFSFFLFDKKVGEKIIAAALFFSLLFSIIFFRFWYYSSLPYYQNFARFILGIIPQEKYLESFGQDVNQNYKLASFLSENTQKNEKIFVWGDSPCVYALSRRLPVGRYATSYHIIDFEDYQQILEAIEKQKPRFIIDLKNENRPFPGLSALVKREYSFFKKEGRAEIFVTTPSH